MDTVRGWLRRFSGQIEAVRGVFTVWLRALDPDPVMPGPAGDRWADALVAIVAAARAAAGRVAFTWCCPRAVPAARPKDFGTLGVLVAGTQPLLVPLLWTVPALVCGVFAVASRPWFGRVGVAPRHRPRAAPAPTRPTPLRWHH